MAAKVQIKNDKTNSFGGIFFIIDQFRSSGLATLVDKSLGVKGWINTRYPYSNIVENLTSVFGRSGSGKTVLMKCLVGLFTPEEGEVLYSGREFHNLPEKEKLLLRKEMGMVFQGSALFDSMTIEENVTFPLNMFTDMSESEMRDRANFCLECVDLVNTNRLYPAELSGGMKKRAAIARALACNPKYLFFDEPNSGLDPKTSLLIDELITKITHEFNTTTVVNTHDLNSIITIGETISFIYQGRLEWRGSSDNILASDNQTLNDFIYAQPLTQRLRKTL